FVERGGGLLATGETSLFDEWGDARSDFALGDIFGAHTVRSKGADDPRRRNSAVETAHTYLRITPERRAFVDGPKTGNEPAVTAERHQVLRGFEETDILPFGGMLEDLKVDPAAKVLLTFVPSFPIYPPETS